MSLEQARGLAAIGDAQTLTRLSQAHIDAVRRQPDRQGDFLRRATARHEAKDLALSVGKGGYHGFHREERPSNKPRLASRVTLELGER